MIVRLILVVILVVAPFMLAMNAVAQENSTAAEQLDSLRLQLIEVQAREESLKARAEQLELELKPENIERALAGIGSTRPEELRESRRRQLSAERDGVLAQLRIVESDRNRLEAAIANTQARAYQESAAPPIPSTQKIAATPGAIPYLAVILGSAAVLAIVGGVVVFSILRKKST